MAAKSSRENFVNGDGNNGRGSWRGRGGRFAFWKRGRGRGHYGNKSSYSSQNTHHVANSQSSFPGRSEDFSSEAYLSDPSLLMKINVFGKYLQARNYITKQDFETNNNITVDCKDLIEFLLEDLPNVADDIKSSPETVINCLGLAMSQLILRSKGDSTDATSERIHCRLVNYEPKTLFKQLRGHLFGKFVAVRGTVVRVSNIKPLCTQLAFECGKCAAIQTLSLPEGRFRLPTKCNGEECRSRTFHPKRNHPLTETIDWQTIRLQEIATDDDHESGRIPRTVDCELTRELVDCCVPGDIVTVCGIVKVVSTDEGSHSRNKDKCMYTLYILANSVANNKGKQQATSAECSSVIGSSCATVDFTLKELYAIEAIQAEKNLFRLLVGSLCPVIYGHEIVKAGLVLALFGGCPRFANSKNCIPVRGDIHVLIVGDPGLGKSQMLQALTNLAPRSVYVCGNTSTTSGLTVTLSKESGGGSGGSDYTLEAGALVLADQGCCCIDEFDKMGHHHQALLEAMEQQSISIAKAGIVCRLPARTSIVAAANPIGGHYNKAKTVAENLRMGSALLSRFDLVFILLDKPDEHMDSLLSEHVMALHSGKSRFSCKSTPSTSVSQNCSIIDAVSLESNNKPLTETLKWPRNEQLSPIPPQLFRKYVAYARKYVQPKITPGAANKIQEFYLELRRKHQTQDSTPITTRQLESLIRLTEARARIELREETTEQDAEDVIQIMKHSMIDTYSDEFGALDFQRSQHGAGSSKQAQAKTFVAALQKLSERNYNSLFAHQELKQIASDMHLKVRDFEEFLMALNTQGYLLKKGNKMYQLVTASF